MTLFKKINIFIYFLKFYILLFLLFIMFFLLLLKKWLNLAKYI